MYLKEAIEIPQNVPGISTKSIKGTTYIYYTYSREYDPENQYSVPKSTSIGKLDPNNPGRMFPNMNFLKFFPEVELPEEKSGEVYRSSCLRAGAYLVLRKIVAEYDLEEILEKVIGKDSGLFLDLAIYTIISEDNAGQYYPDYAFNHPLFTNGMKIYSDSKGSKSCIPV